MKIILCGSEGKCGSVVYQHLCQQFHEVYCVNKDKISLEEQLKNVQNVDYIVDFTNKEVALKHLNLAIQHHIPFLCGTTGFSNEEIQLLKEKCKKNKLKGYICPNFSIPLTVLIKNLPVLANDAEEVLYQEVHHTSKKDIPSGTAKLCKTLYPNLKISSYQEDTYTITYLITFVYKYATMVIDYKVESKDVYAEGLIYALQHPEFFYNLL